MVTANLSAEAVLSRYLQDAASSFSIGVPAAVAEFMRVADEPLLVEEAEALTVATMRGAIRLVRRGDAVPVAYETPSRRPERWLQGVVFCLPEAKARMGGGDVLSELGPDRDAVRPDDRGAILFDLGVGAPQLDFCIRTAEPALIGVMRRHLGRPAAEWPGEAVTALLETGPHRVVVSRLGRIEVAQPIPHERTPLGPHTHLFFDRLGDGRSHDEGLPVPAGYLPCLQLYPPNPLFDLAGDDRPLDAARFGAARFQAFQDLLEAWGDSEYRAAKARVLAAFESGTAPENFAAPRTPLERLATRVALRQRR
jgi:hypothetical protein